MVDLCPLNTQIKKFTLGGEIKTFITFDLKPKQTAEQHEAIHHIHILDRSGSMSGHIEALMDDVKKTLDMTSPEDFITVIWFSGVNEYRTVVKCAKNDAESIGKILDSLKSVVGCTCFSDPVKELEQIINETAPLCGVFNITIFTDGDTVTPWPAETEARKIFDNLDSIKDKILAFNAVGYGNYYNRELLMKMTKTTEYGLLAHASQIEEYSAIFTNNKNTVSGLSRFKASVSCRGADIVCLSPQSVKLYNEKADIRIGKQGNTFGIITDGTVETVKVEINGLAKSFDAGKISVSDFDKSSADIAYAYAYVLYFEGQRKKALEALNLIGDRTLMNKQYSAFTVGETGDYLKTLQNCALKRGKRNILEMPSNTYVPDDNALCVLDVLKKLVELDAEYFPTESYQRIGKKVIDEFNCFVKEENQQSVSMSGIVLNQDRLNISLRFEIKGKVKLNPKRAKPVGLPLGVNAKIYRVHTVVRDGALNINTIKVKINKEAGADFIQSLGNAAQITDTLEDGIILSVSLSEMPVINNSYLSGFDAKKLLDFEIGMIRLEADNKVINSLLKESGGAAAVLLSGFNDEQAEVLREHGIGADMVYSAVNPKRLEVEDYYVVKEFRTQLKGFGTLPPLAKVISKVNENKKLTPSEEIIYLYYKQNEKTDRAGLIAQKAANQKELNRLRFEASGAKLASVLTGSLPQGLEPQDDGSYSYSGAGYTLIVKLERKEIPV